MGISAWIFAPQKISTDLLGIFPENVQTQQLRDAATLSTLNRLLIYSKGVDADSRNRIDAIATALQDVKGITSVSWRTDTLTSHTAKVLRDTYLQRSDFHPERLKTEAIRKRIEEAYREASTSLLFTPLNTADPLGLFSDPLLPAGQNSVRGGRFVLEGKGYLLTATVALPVADVEGAKALYRAVTDITAPYGDSVSAFAPHFYTAQNSEKIKHEVSLIVTATVVLLLIGYVLFLRDVRILLLSTIALGGSLFVALAVTTALFDTVSVFTLAFGSGIVMMAVDYLFHYYFHGYYANRTKERRQVFYAFVTTLLGFGLLAFADFPLIAQLSVFALAALFFSYWQFTWLFEAWTLSPRPNRLRLPKSGGGFVPPWGVALFSLALLAAGSTRLHFDSDLRHLDYQNSALKGVQQQFAAAQRSRAVILIYGESFDGVVARARSLKSAVPSLRSVADALRTPQEYAAYKTSVESVDFDGVRSELASAAKEAGFREGIFADAYRFVKPMPPYHAPGRDVLERLGFETKPLATGKWISVAYADKAAAGAFAGQKDVVVLKASELLAAGVKGVLEELMVIGASALLLIAVILVFLFRTRMLRSLNYILFPLAVIIALVALEGSFSVMHLFALVIVMVAGIDYGIYMNRPDPRTDEAIYYAMLSTFAGFGIFVFSHIGALHDIGTVIATGIAATFVLQHLQKRKAS